MIASSEQPGRHVKGSSDRQKGHTAGTKQQYKASERQEYKAATKDIGRRQQ